MTRLWQLGAALVLATGLAGCGVAVDQRTLQTTATPPQAPRADTAATPSAEPVPEAPPKTVAKNRTLAQVPAISDIRTDIAVDTAKAETAADADVEIASLAPSAAASIDDLLKPASPAETQSPQVTTQAREGDVADDGEDQVARLSPRTPPAPSGDAAQKDDGQKDDGQKDDTGAAGDVVGDIIWNLEAANRARPAPPPAPQIPVGPDPSLASDALEAAFAQIARREHALPDDVFVLPPKAAGTTRIALLIPVTGPNAALGAELQKGAELALFSVRNPKIELLVLDTHGDGPEAAASQAVVAGADIVVGPLFSDAVVSARRIARQANIPMLALSNNLKVAGSGSWLLGYVPEQQVDALLGYALTTGGNRIGIIAEDAPFGQILARHAVDRLAQFGLRPVESLTLTASMLADEDQLKSAIRSFTGYQPPATNETAPAFADLPPARFDALLFAGSADFALRTAPVLAYYDADPERVLYLGNAQWNQQRILTEPSLQGGVFVSRPTGRDDAFNRLWSDIWPSRPGALARLSFDAMAMATVLTGQQRQLWQAALESESGFSGFSGAYRLLPGGGNQRAFELRRIENGVSAILQPAPDKI
jgi:ABC-type branched-subunit amino acid transport system substrate-binding protein